ncbi:MAG: MBL fold metallo-hydrolase [Actinomycetales bacterium]
MTEPHPVSQQTYDGEVRVGGPSQSRDLGCLRLTKLAVGDMSNNAYLLECTQTGEQLLVDAAAEPDRLLELIGDRPLTGVVTTHRHEDHWARGLGAVVAATGAPTYAGRADAEAIGVATDEVLDDGDELWVGACRLEVIGLIGHTPGSIALAYTETDDGPQPGRVHVLTGDSLFPGGVGRTWSPEDFRSLVDDVESKLFDRFPDSTWVYPGHGADTTLGADRGDLAAWRDRGW